MRGKEIGIIILLSILGGILLMILSPVLEALGRPIYGAVPKVEYGDIISNSCIALPVVILVRIVGKRL